jgi:hypothetical protein
VLPARNVVPQVVPPWLIEKSELPVMLMLVMVAVPLPEGLYSAAVRWFSLP